MITVEIGNGKAVLDALDANAAAIAAEAARAPAAENLIAGRVTALEGALPEKADGNALTTLAGRVTTAEGNIAASAGSISALATRVTAAEGDIASSATAGSVATLATQIGAVEGALPGKVDVGALTMLAGRVTTAEGDIDASAGAISALATRVGGVETGKASLADRDATNDRVTALETGATAAADAIATLTTGQTAATGHLAAIDQRFAADEAAAASLGEQVTDLEGQLVGKAALVTAVSRQGRPGDLIERFTTIGATVVAVAADAGNVRRITGAGQVTMRERVALDPARLYRFRWAAKRFANPSDPSGATVRFGLQYYAADGSALASVAAQNTTLNAADGRLIFSITVAAAAAANVAAWPAGACYVSPLVQTFDLDGVTDVQWIDWGDVSDALTVSDAASAAITAAVGAADSRAQTAEVALGQRIDDEHVNLSNNVTTLQQRIDVNSGAITALGQRIDDEHAIVVGDVTTIQQRIDVTSGAITALGQRIDDEHAILVGDVTTLQQRIDVNSGAITALGQRIDDEHVNLSNNVTTLQQRIDVNSGGITALGQRIDDEHVNLSNNVTTLQGRIDGANGTITAETSRATTVETTLAAQIAALGGGAPPATFDALSATITVPAASITYPGDRVVSWASAPVTSPATTPVTGLSAAISAGAGVTTWLDYRTILTIAVTRNSDGATMVAGTNFAVDYADGFVINITGEAMTGSYSGSPERKDLISIDPRLATPVLTLTQGAAKPRNGHLYAPALPDGHQEIARVTRKGSHAWLIPNWLYRNGVRLDRLAAEAEGRDYNRRILAPVVSRLSQALPVLFTGEDNSRGAIGGFGAFPLLNVNPGSYSDPNPANSWQRDVSGYYQRYTAADLALFGYNNPVSFNRRPGFNLGAGAADGFGAVHIMAGFVWELILQLHRMYPRAVIGYDNWSIGGTDTSNSQTSDGRSNALYPDRYNAVMASIATFTAAYGPGSVVYIPPNPTNEFRSSASYDNWKLLAAGAQANGAVVHMMGLAPQNPLYADRTTDAAFSAQEMARAAWASNSAISDGWRITGALEVCGRGLLLEEVCSATGINHEDVPPQRALGQDAANSYI